MTTFIRGGTVVSIDDAIGNRTICHILVENDTITKVGRHVEAPADVTVNDATDRIVSPGFVDTHRHTWQSQLKNLTSDMLLMNYFLYVRKVYGSCYTAEDVYRVNSWARWSPSRRASHFLSIICIALKDTHIRGVFCYGMFVNRDWEGVAPGTVTAATEPDWRYEDARRVREQHFSKDNGPDDLLRFGFAPAEIESFTPEQSIREIQFGRELGAALITGHIAMGKMDRGMQFLRQMGKRKLLGPDLLFSHCSALTNDEITLAREHGVGSSCTPEMELQMAMGPCVSFKAERKGCKHSLGVEVACNSPVDMFQQMRLLLQSERNSVNVAAEGVPTTIAHKCESVLRFATMGGAECVGLKDVIGSIIVGKRADLTATKTTSTCMTPVHDPVAALVLYANTSDVDTVLVNGRVVKRHGKFVDFDWPTLRKEFLQSSENVMRRARAAPMDEIKAYLEAAFARG